jgi:hypothetical protein
MPRQTISRGVPFGCTHPHAAQSFLDRIHRLDAGFSEISPRMNATSVRVTALPRYLKTVSMRPV